MHNIIAFDKKKEKLYLDLIDAKEMQRLRRIRQLGASYVTYPGAEHSRFAHSLGCAHLMMRKVEKLVRLSEKDEGADLLPGIAGYKDLLICAAILHDVGHGPFSHSIEKVFKQDHEHWTKEIILDSSTEVNKILRGYNQEYPQKVSDIIDKVFEPRYVVKLLSSQLDVDRIDYLLRDALMTGANYGIFDLEWLLKCITVGKVHDSTEIGIEYKKGKMVAEEFILARRAMYLQVYFHKATRSAEVLIRNILRRATDLTGGGKRLTAYKPLKVLLNKQKLTVEQYLRLDDHVITHHFNVWRCNQDKVLADLCRRFLDRRLFKSVPVGEDWALQFDVVDKLREACETVGLPFKYYVEGETIPHSSYADYYVIQKGKGSTVGEKSERIYLFKDAANSEELSAASEIIAAIRNKTIFVRRLHYPQEIESAVKRIFGR